MLCWIFYPAFHWSKTQIFYFFFLFIGHSMPSYVANKNFRKIIDNCFCWPITSLFLRLTANSSPEFWIEVSPRHARDVMNWIGIKYMWMYVSVMQNSAMHSTLDRTICHWKEVKTKPSIHESPSTTPSKPHLFPFYLLARLPVLLLKI